MQNRLQERQTLALELLAGSVDRLVSIQAQRDSGGHEDWNGFDSGSGLDQEGMEVDRKDREKENENEEEEVNSETMKE